nr:hypothetical protein Iba_chr15cCG8970 [Ipomoea batatas]
MPTTIPKAITVNKGGCRRRLPSGEEKRGGWCRRHAPLAPSPENRGDELRHCRCTMLSKEEGEAGSGSCWTPSSSIVTPATIAIAVAGVEGRRRRPLLSPFCRRSPTPAPTAVKPLPEDSSPGGEGWKPPCLFAAGSAGRRGHHRDGPLPCDVEKPESLPGRALAANQESPPHPPPLPSSPPLLLGSVVATSGRVAYRHCRRWSRRPSPPTIIVAALPLITYTRTCRREAAAGGPRGKYAILVRRAGEDDGQVRAAEMLRYCRAEGKTPLPSTAATLLRHTPARTEEKV